MWEPPTRFTRRKRPFSPASPERFDSLRPAAHAMMPPDLRIRKPMRIFSVPVSAPFLRTVIGALVDGRLIDGFEARARPERLATATLYLPTRRAGRLAHSIFLDVLGKDAAILPRIVALGDIDEDELAFSEDSEPGGAAPRPGPAKLLQ